MKKKTRAQKKWKWFVLAILAFLLAYAVLALLRAVPFPSSAAPEHDAVSSGGSAVFPGNGEPPGFLEAFPFLGNSAAPEEDAFSLYDRSTGESVTVSGRRLLCAAVACEMDLSAPEEALKAQAVACYTLFCRQRDAGEQIQCDSEGWQVWTTEEEMRSRWGEDTDGYLSLLNSVVDSVYGQRLEWEGRPILAAYSAISAGSTAASENVWGQELPYLRAVASPGDPFSDGYLSFVEFSPEEFRKAAETAFPEADLDFSGPEKDWLTDLTYTDSGYVGSALLGGVERTGAQLRAAFSLRSACFSLEYREQRFYFTVRGWGHGVGMSQAGAVFFAKRGKDYREILAHYYPGAVLVSGARK